MPTKTFGGTPVTVTGLELPPKRAVLFNVDLMGPGTASEQQEYQVKESDRELFVVITSLNASSIGFSLTAAKEAMPHKTIEVYTPLDKLFRFDMPLRFIAGLKAVAKAVYNQGYEVYFTPSMAQALDQKLPNWNTEIMELPKPKDETKSVPNISMPHIPAMRAEAITTEDTEDDEKQ